MACSGSNGSARPRAAAVDGMNWAKRSAPAGLTTPARKLLSRQITRVTNSTGRCAAWAERSIVRHTAWSSDSIRPGAAWQGSATPPHNTANIAAQRARYIIGCGLRGALPGENARGPLYDPRSGGPLLSRWRTAVLVFSQLTQYAIWHLGGKYGRSPRGFDQRRPRQGRRV